MECVAVATAATRKALAAARPLRDILRVRVLGVFHRRHPYLYSGVFDSKVLVEVDRGGRGWAEAVAYAAASRDCDAVLPMDYVDYLTLSLYRRVFEEVGVVLVSPPHEAIAAASDKRLLQRMGLPVPRGVVVEEGVVRGDPSSLEPPLVVKGVGDASSPRYHAALEDALADALGRRDAVVQEFVAGRGRGYFALAFRGRPVLEFSHERLVEYEPVGGASLAARGPIEDPELYRLGRLVVGKLEWSGVVMVEARYSLEDDEYYVIEVNPKLWGSLDLAVHCNRHFPALVVAAHVLGWSEAEALAEKLGGGGRCTYSWLLDGLRYLAKIPSVVARLARLCLHGGCDLDPLDAARVAAQLAAAASRLGRERSRWRMRLEEAAVNARRWVERAASIAARGGAVVAWDLDGTLARLPVDWGEARRRLEEAGFEVVAGSVMATLARLWGRDRRGFEEASRIVEEVEAAAVERAELLVDRRALVELRSLAQRFILVTRQSSRVAEAVLERLGVRSLFDEIVGRDEGSMSKGRVLERLGGPGILVDDNFEAVVAAWRRGWAPVLATRDEYSAARAYTLGIPAAGHREIPRLLGVVLRGSTPSV